MLSFILKTKSLFDLIKPDYNSWKPSKKNQTQPQETEKKAQNIDEKPGVDNLVC